MIAKCQCQYCGGAIEFDAADFVESGRRGNQILGQFVPCPHCGKDTIIFIENKPAPAMPPRQPASETFKAEAESQSSKKSAAILLDIASAVLFIIGCGMVFDGCAGDSAESLKENGSAIRQTVFAILYGSGFILMALSLILAALVRIIRKP